MNVMDSNLDRSNRLFSSTNRPDNLWSPLSHLFNGYRVFFLGKKRPGRDVENNLYLAPGLRTVELHIYYSYIHPQRWQELLFLYFVYSIRVDTNLALVFVWIICNTKFYGFWRRDISIFIKCKGVCFHYLKQFNLIGVKQAWNFVSSTTKPKYKLS